MENALKHLYINPLEKCNLACKICYTKKTKFVLSNQKILDFVNRYQKIQKLNLLLSVAAKFFYLKIFPIL